MGVCHPSGLLKLAGPPVVRTIAATFRTSSACDPSWFQKAPAFDTGHSYGARCPVGKSLWEMCPSFSGCRGTGEEGQAELLSGCVLW